MKQVIPTIQLIRQVYNDIATVLTEQQQKELVALVKRGLRSPAHEAMIKGIPTFVIALDTAATFATEAMPDANVIPAILLVDFVREQIISEDEVKRIFGDDALYLITQLIKVERLSNRNAPGNNDNFRGLLLSLAEDIRVIMVMIVRSLVLMKRINMHPDEEWVQHITAEASLLYAPLAHRLGLYGIKSILEDLSLKYSNRTIYKQIASRLNETKRSRDAYIEAFIQPVKERLTAAGLNFSIKGRTKTISSIWNKIKNKKVDVNRIRDLFAIRVIIDTPPEREKADCWLAYSIVANMYTPDPDRLRDWLTFPKSNGYESLHTTVLGPEDKWVEVQIRTRRMDLVAEKGLAAHWKYKGGKSDSSDQWMANVREVLESTKSDPLSLMKNIRIDSTERDVYIFTPKGDLMRLSPESTLLDFAFAVHSAVGCKCTGGVVNGKYEKISYRLQNGDSVKILTSPTQTPRHDWLNIVHTSKARAKIKQSLDDAKRTKAELGKEIFERRAKNRKLEIDEAILMKMIGKWGYKFANDFFADMADEKVDAGKFLTAYLQAVPVAQDSRVSADEFQIERHDNDAVPADDILVIGTSHIKGLEYKFAKCCSPMPGDPVFGFISSDGAIKIHRNDCPNSRQIYRRYPYRVIGVRWSDDSSAASVATLRIVGKDDIGIVTNITSIIDKEEGIGLRNISIDSNDGLFCGFVVVTLKANASLSALIKKIKTIKGVKDAVRI